MALGHNETERGAGGCSKPVQMCSGSSWCMRLGRWYRLQERWRWALGSLCGTFAHAAGGAAGSVATSTPTALISLSLVVWAPAKLISAATTAAAMMTGDIEGCSFGIGRFSDGKASYLSKTALRYKFNWAEGHATSFPEQYHMYCVAAVV